MNDRRVLAIYVLSGASGLIYEVVWSRLLALSVGAEATAVTAVLVAFMGGLALGAFLGGLLARSRVFPLRDYGMIELALGVVCLAVPTAIRALGPLLEPAYASFGPTLGFHVVRAIACALVLAVPTTLMGATLPVLARGGEPGALYAANTFGAVLGALLAGFVLVPSLGVATTNALAALGNVTVGLVAIALGRGRAAPAEAALAPGKGESARLALLGFALSGAAAMAFQLSWTRAFAIILGPTTYSFSVMLAAYILGHAIGSQRAAAKAARLAHPLAVLAGLIVAAAFSALAVVPLVDWVPTILMPSVNRVASSFALHALAQFALAFAFVAVPAGLFGTAFALVTRRVAPGPAYAANSLGAVAGTLAAALWIPAFGIGSTLKGGAVLAAVAGLVFAGASEVSKGRRVAIGASVAAAATALVIPRWEPLRLNSGAYLYGVAGTLTGGSNRNDAVLFYKEGFSGAVLVARGAGSGSLYLKIDGKVDAGTGAGDMRTQLLLGHVPCLALDRRPERALVVGLGSGVTARAVLAQGVPDIDVVEIEPALVESVRRSPLMAVSHEALDRIQRLLVADARAVYALEPKRYDVIISEPSNPWIAGIGNLFTKEAFTLARERLAPRGVFCQWIHAGYSSLETFSLVARTFLEVFPRAWMFEVFPNTDYLLVAAREGELGEPGADRFTPAVAEDLELLELESAEDVVGFHRALSPEALRAFAGPGPINTDDSARLEFMAPLAVTAKLDLLRDPSFASRRVKGLRARDLALEALAAAREESISREECARVLSLVEDAFHQPGYTAARPLLRQAVASALVGARGARALAPEDLLERGTALLEVLWSGAPPTRRGNAAEEAKIGILLRNLARFSDNVPDLIELGELLAKARGDRVGARKALRVALETDPTLPGVREAIAALGRR